MFEKKENEKFLFPSPLKLLYTAYSDERPVFNSAMEEGFQKLDTLLSSLTEQERNTVLQTVYKIYTEKEALAFQAGVKTGVRLVKELI